MNDTFPIKLVRERSAHFTFMYNVCCIIGIVGLLILYLSMSPSEHSSVELKAFWFIEGVPLWVKQAAFYGVIALCFALLIYFLNNKSTKGELLINDEKLIVNTSKEKMDISYKMIKEIVIVPRPVFKKDEPDNLMVFIRTSKGAIRAKLLFPLMGDQLMGSLTTLESKNIKVTTAYDDPVWLD